MQTNDLPDEDREREPPDPIPNSEVKPFIGNGSVGPPHVRVAHRQASKLKRPSPSGEGLFTLEQWNNATTFYPIKKQQMICHAPQVRVWCALAPRRGCEYCLKHCVAHRIVRCPSRRMAAKSGSVSAKLSNSRSS